MNASMVEIMHIMMKLSALERAKNVAKINSINYYEILIVKK